MSDYKRDPFTVSNASGVLQPPLTAPDQDAAHLEYTQLQAENQRLRAALRELYEATHDYLNVTDAAGRMKAGTPRLNAALGAAWNAIS